MLGAMPSRSRFDMVRVVEQAYAIDATQSTWLQGLVDALRPGLEDRLGMAAYVYDASVRPLAIHDPILDCPLDLAGLSSLMASSSENYVRGAWLSQSVATASETPGYAEHPGVKHVFHPLGIHDVFVLNVLDPSGVGCLIGAPLRALRTLTTEERARWDRIAAHLRAALRLRLRLSASEATAAPPETSGKVEAIFRADGRAEELTSASENARESLRSAVVDMDRARHHLRPRQDRALASWRVLVRNRWTLVDSFTEGSKRYIVARANAPADAGHALLTEREQQVVSLVAMGHDYKLIAYELGISHSTVRVLLARARAKLGASDRRDLVEKFRKS